MRNPPNRFRAAAMTGWKGSRREPARELGLSERTLYRRLRALGIRD
jgi:transcriptional regulator of acetoin/glycerol metabolism